MGITNLLNLVRVKHPKCLTVKKIFQNNQLTEVDHILVDICQFYYYLPRDLFPDPAKASEQIFSSIMKLIKSNFSVPKTIYFAFEGSGPRSKQLLQRSRREKKIGTSRYPMTAMLSCGSEYMQEIKDRLCFEVATYLSKDAKYKNTQFLVSGPETMGEGEFKLIQYMNLLPKNESCVALSSDSDMIFMALLSQNLNFIHSPFMMPHFLKPDERSLLDIKTLKAELTANFKGNLETAYMDFVFLGFLGGSDYATKLGNAPELSKLWDIYRGLKLTPEYQDREIITRDLAEETTTIDLEFLDKILEKKVKVVHEHINIKIGNKALLFSVKSSRLNLDSLVGCIPYASLEYTYLRGKNTIETFISLLISPPSTKGEEKDEQDNKNKRILLSVGKSSRKKISEELAIEQVLVPGSQFLKLLRENVSLQDFDKIQGVLNNVNYSENIQTMFLKTGKSSSSEVFNTSKGEFMDNPVDLATKFLQLNVWVLNYYMGMCNSYSSHIHLNPRPFVEDIRALAQIQDRLVILWEKDTHGPLVPFANLVAIVPVDASNFVPLLLKNFFDTDSYTKLFKPSEKINEGVLEANNALYLKCHEVGVLSKSYLEEKEKRNPSPLREKIEIERVLNNFLSFQPTMRFVSRHNDLLSNYSQEEIKVINAWELVLKNQTFKSVLCVPFHEIEDREEKESNTSDQFIKEQQKSEQIQKQIQPTRPLSHHNFKQPKTRFSIIDKIDKCMLQKRNYYFKPHFNAPNHINAKVSFILRLFK